MKKAVILAAGQSSRLRSVTKTMPKCLLKFGGRAILDHQLDSLFAAGVEQVAIVVGWEKEQILSHIAKTYPHRAKQFTFIENPQYLETNNIYSLWLAQEWIGGTGFICLNADVLYHPGIIVPALKTSAAISIIMDEAYRDETMKVIVRDGLVQKMSKAIGRSDYSGTYIGITSFSSRICGAFFQAMRSMVEAGKVNVFFNVAVEQLIAAGTPVNYTLTESLPWTEVDDPRDFELAQNMVYPQIEALVSGNATSLDSSPRQEEMPASRLALDPA